MSQALGTFVEICKKLSSQERKEFLSQLHHNVGALKSQQTFQEKQEVERVRTYFTDAGLARPTFVACDNKEGERAAVKVVFTHEEGRELRMVASFTNCLVAKSEEFPLALSIWLDGAVVELHTPGRVRPHLKQAVNKFGFAWKSIAPYAAKLRHFILLPYVAEYDCEYEDWEEEWDESMEMSGNPLILPQWRWFIKLAKFTTDALRFKANYGHDYGCGDHAIWKKCLEIFVLKLRKRVHRGFVMSPAFALRVAYENYAVLPHDELQDTVIAVLDCGVLPGPDLVSFADECGFERLLERCTKTVM